MFWSNKEKLKIQLMEKQPLPIGILEFEAWAHRIISGAMLPATDDSQMFTLANMLMHLGPTEAFKEDAYFINSLRKYAVNQVADQVRQDLYAAKQARLEAEKQAVTPTGGAVDVLENKTV